MAGPAARGGAVRARRAMPCGQPESGGAAAPARYVLGVDVGSTAVKCHVYDRVAAVRGSSCRKVKPGGTEERGRAAAAPSAPRRRRLPSSGRGLPGAALAHALRGRLQAARGLCAAGTEVIFGTGLLVTRCRGRVGASSPMSFGVISLRLVGSLPVLACRVDRAGL